MSAPIGPQTGRLLLRQWRDNDYAPFAALNADPRVMRYFPAPLGRAQSDAAADRYRMGIAEHGWGLWALERKDSGAFIGFVGLAVPSFELPFPSRESPCVEIGWRLAFAHWGKGFATEAAHAALRVGFETLRLSEIVSFTAAINEPSRKVMSRIGMREDAQGFDHPNVPADSELRRHCLYRLNASEWRGLQV